MTSNYNVIGELKKNMQETIKEKMDIKKVNYDEWKKMSENEYVSIYDSDQMAFSIGDRFVSIQECADGYDYSIFYADYTLFDGGVYDNPNITIYAALKDILEDMGVSEKDKLIPVDYEELIEKSEAAEQAKIQEAVKAKQTVSDFKAKTNEMFREIGGLNAEDMEMTAMAYILSKIDEYDIDVEIVDVAVTGSRCRGLEQEGSDIDIVVEYKGREHENDLFNAFNEDGLKIGGVKVDINPIMEGKTGTLATYLLGVENYLEEKRKTMEKHQLVFLAIEIDELSCEYAPYQYKDIVEDREAQVANIAEDIRSGNTGYLNDFLNTIISEEIRNSMVDIFEQGDKP